jgi:hypothetical protein
MLCLIKHPPVAAVASVGVADFAAEAAVSAVVWAVAFAEADAA